MSRRHLRKRKSCTIIGMFNVLLEFQPKMKMWFTHTNNIAMGFVGGDNDIFVMKEKQVLSNIWIFKDWCRARAHRPTEFYLRDVFAKGPTYREPKSINWKHNYEILMDSVEDYARQLAKREKEDLDILSECVKSVRYPSFNNQAVYVMWFTHTNNIAMGFVGGDNDIFVMKEKQVLSNIWISTKDEELDLPSLYWIPKLHKCPFKQRYIAGSAKYSTKPLSKLLTCILSVVKTELQSCQSKTRACWWY
jgi:hypothetical protein